MSKKLMVLGASYTQIPLFQAARRIGVHTIAASIPGNYAGFSYADEIAYVNIADPIKVLDAAREREADGVATCGLDLGMAAIGEVSETLKLSGPPRAAARAASNKLLMKQCFVKADVQTAPFQVIYSRQDLTKAAQTLTFPLVIKAVDQMGSRGVFRCDSPEDLEKNYTRTMEATNCDYCIVEEFIEGTLFGCEAMIENGKILFMMPDNTEAFLSAVPTPIGHSVPFEKEAELGAQVREQVTKAIDALGLDNCPVNCDLIRTEDQVWVVEMTGRSGATGLAEIVSDQWGIDYYEAIVRVALGMDAASLFTHRKDSACIAQTLLSNKTGTLKSIGFAGEKPEGLIDLSFNVKPGDAIRAYTNGRDRIGQVILSASTLREAREELSRLLKGIQIDLEA